MASKAVEGEENVWLTDEQSCDVIVCLVRGTTITENSKRKRQRQRNEILIHTTCEVLGRNPFFAACLSEPWRKEREQDGSPVQLTVETRMGTPGAYRRCIELLCSREGCSPYRFKCPTEALDIFLAADHLNFQECATVCLEYLAAAPWSSEEEVAIGTTFSTTSLQPSSDVAARLGVPYEKSVTAFKNVLNHLYSKRKTRAYDYGDEIGGDPSGKCWDGNQKDQFEAVVEGYLKCRGAKEASMVKAVMEVVEEVRARQLKEAKEQKPMTNPAGLGNLWYWVQMTDLVLKWTDGKAVVEEFACDAELQGVFQDKALRSEKGCRFRTKTGMKLVFFSVLMVVFERVAEAKVILPASARRSLLKAWLPWLRDTMETTQVVQERVVKALTQIMKTLPMDDETLLLWMAISYPGSSELSLLREAFNSWHERLSSQCTITHAQ